MNALGDLDDQVAAVLVGLDLLDDAVDAADGEDLVAELDGAEQPLLRLHLRALRADHGEPEHAEQHHDDQEFLAQILLGAAGEPRERLRAEVVERLRGRSHPALRRSVDE